MHSVRTPISLYKKNIIVFVDSRDAGAVCKKPRTFSSRNNSVSNLDHAYIISKMIKLQFTAVQNDLARRNVERFIRNLEQIFEEYQKLVCECLHFCKDCKNASAMPLLQMELVKHENHENITLLEHTPPKSISNTASLSSYNSDSFKESGSHNNSEFTIKETDNEDIPESPVLKKRKRNRRFGHKADKNSLTDIIDLSTQKNVLSEICDENKRLQTPLRAKDLNKESKLTEIRRLPSSKSPKEKQQSRNEEESLFDDEVIENSPKLWNRKRKYNRQKLKGKQLLKSDFQSKTELDTQKKSDNNIEAVIATRRSADKIQISDSRPQDLPAEDTDAGTSTEMTSEETYFEYAELQVQKKLPSGIPLNTDMKLQTVEDIDESFDIVPPKKEVVASGSRRCKAERVQMEGHDCWCCQEYYQDFEHSDEQRKIHQKHSSRHRGSVAKRSRKDSQEFWNPLFPASASYSFIND